MTVSREKTFMDWLFGANPPPQAELAIHLGEARERIDQLQRALEEQRANHLQECEAMRQASLQSEARLAQRQTELELELGRVNQEWKDAKAGSDVANAELARLGRGAVELRAASLRDAEARRKLTTRCSALQIELDRLRGELQQARAEQGADLESHQAELEQKQRELRALRTEAARSSVEAERQRKAHEQASLEQRGAVEAERRAWGLWLGDVWSALLHSVGPAAPLALETSFGQLEPVARAATTEVAEARLRELVAARSLCRNLTIVEQQHELRLELELGPAIEGTAAGWLGILATRYLSAMLERPLRTREIELTGERVAVQARA